MEYSVSDKNLVMSEHGTPSVLSRNIEAPASLQNHQKGASVCPEWTMLRELTEVLRTMSTYFTRWETRLDIVSKLAPLPWTREIRANDTKCPQYDGLLCID
jgi:hypothetical protein